MSEKKIAIINSVYEKGSTGRICKDLCYFFNHNGYNAHVFYGRGNKTGDSFSTMFSNIFNNCLDALKCRVFDNSGFNSKAPTRKLIKHLEKYNPDIIILNNLHGYYINLKILFSFVKKRNIKILFVLHDCWSFTGHCTHFSQINCEKWKTTCENCPCKFVYPKSLFLNRSKQNFIAKKNIFNDLNLTIVSPSNWLANLARVSFLGKYKIKVINNGIDVGLFSKKEKIVFRQLNNLQDYNLILCIAYIFDKKKGIDDVIKLSQVINSKTKIIVVGKTKTDLKKYTNILHFDKTDSIDELIDIYSSCDVFFNPTYEDNYPTVNMEALSCGAPTVCYRTGGAYEMLDDRFVVEQGDIDGAYKLMQDIFEGKINYNFEKVKDFDSSIMHEKYLKLIKEILHEDTNS